MARHPLTCRPICSASPMSSHSSDFALRRPRHLLAVARNVPQSVIVPLLLPHRLFGTACRRTYGHPHRCSCSDVGSSLSFFGVLWAQDTLRDFYLAATWPRSIFLTLRHVNQNSFIIIIIISAQAIHRLSVLIPECVCCCCECVFSKERIHLMSVYAPSWQTPKMWKPRRPFVAFATNVRRARRAALIQYQINTVKQFLHFLWLLAVKFLTEKQIPFSEVSKCLNAVLYVTSTSTPV